MFNKLSELAEMIRDMPRGTVLDDKLRADILGRIASIGRGEPQASTGESWADFEARIRAMYQAPDQATPLPSGPAGPKPPPAPPVVPDEPPAFRGDGGYDTIPTPTKRPR